MMERQQQQHIADDEHNNVQLPAREGDTTHNEQGPIRRAGKAAPSAINGAMVVAME